MKLNYILKTLFVLFFVFTATAQQGINYKALIKDANGDALANTSITVQFAILENGTTVVFTESHNPTTDVNGIIIINIGEGTSISGDFNSIDWGSNPHFLKTEIDSGDGLTDMGTTEFKTVPYALYAKTAGFVNGDNDTDPTNEIQTLSLEGSTLYLTEGGEVTLPSQEEFAYYYADRDKDAYGDKWSAVYSPSAPAGYVDNETDCNDNDADIFPGATEICDGKDNNCDGNIDEGVTTTYYADNDGDGYGNNEITTNACTEPDGYVSDNTDCDDTDLLIYPGAIEICDGIDSNCDGEVDEGCNVDDDGDGYTIGQGDCNDSNPNINPGAEEICDGIDNDCDQDIDEDVDINTDPENCGACGASCPPGNTCVGGSCVPDTNNDVFITAVNPPQQDVFIGLTTNIQVFINVFGEETISVTYTSGITGPASIIIPEGDDSAIVEITAIAVGSETVTFYIGTSSETTLINVLPDNDEDGDGDGFTVVDGDCNDNDATIYPGATEICEDGIDNNCDGNVDEGCSGDIVSGVYYTVPTPAGANSNCIFPNFDPFNMEITIEGNSILFTVPSNFVLSGTIESDFSFTAQGSWDLDGQILVYVRITGYFLNQTSFNGIMEIYETEDYNLSSLLCVYDISGNLIEDDLDQDGFTVAQGDCDDTNPNINPEAAEIQDGVDNDCDGFIDNYIDLGGDIGIPVNGFPNWEEQMILVLTNRARSDPDAALIDCNTCADVDAGCYTPVPPLEWDFTLNKLARFHAINLTSSGCGMNHDSPCELIATIGTDFPDTRDGSVSSSCWNGVANCGSGEHTTTWERFSLFGISGIRSENIASYGDPKTIFNLWLLEPSQNSTCGFSNDNGHRFNILKSDYNRLGVGASGNYTVQDFWNDGTLSAKIPSGAHWPENGGTNTEFRANWYDASGEMPYEAKINIDGEWYDMNVEFGNGGNATYLFTTDISGISWYYFKFKDSNGNIITFPGSGTYGVGSEEFWSNSRP